MTGSVAQDSATAAGMGEAPAVSSTPSGQETVASSAPSPVGPPDSSYHMKLGYTAAIVIFGAYIALLLKRVAAVRRAR